MTEYTNTKFKGDIGEARFVFEFLKLEIQVSKPFGDNCRYDLIIDVNNKLYKVQIKYCDQITVNNSIVIPCCSSKNHTTNKRYDSYKDDVDFIGAYIPSKDICCLIPISEIKDHKGFIVRDTIPLNNNKDVHYIDDYKIENILLKHT